MASTIIKALLVFGVGVASLPRGVNALPFETTISISTGITATEFSQPHIEDIASLTRELGNLAGNVQALSTDLQQYQAQPGQLALTTNAAAAVTARIAIVIGEINGIDRFPDQTIRGPLGIVSGALTAAIRTAVVYYRQDWHRIPVVAPPNADFMELKRQIQAIQTGMLDIERLFNGKTDADWKKTAITDAFAPIKTELESAMDAYKVRPQATALETIMRLGKEAQLTGHESRISLEDELQRLLLAFNKYPEDQGKFSL